MKYCRNRIKKVLVLFFSILAFVACEDSNGYSELKEVNNFVHDNMEVYYFWNEEMPDLDPDKQTDTEAYFDALLYDKIDRWSLITDDAEAWKNYLAGIRKEFGFSFRFYLDGKSNRYMAFIEYVELDGPADRAGLKRGDIITKIDGEDIGNDNYAKLYNADNIEVGLADFAGGDLTDLTPSVNMEAEELQINPILKNVVFDIDGKKIAYLAYTSFIYDYNDELEDVFADFKAEGVSDLILDLRYNGGGSVETARILSSMICPASCAGKLFLRSAYNDIVEDAIREQFSDNYTEQFEDYFEANENNLNLSSLYVLTTENTASASEMVIYSLSPYMDVVQIGEQTHGKYYGSVTLEDEDGKHTWAIQPIIMRAENVDNSIDYSVGLNPDYEMDDDVFGGELGTTDDVLTSYAINKITGGSFTQEVLKSTPVLQMDKAEGFVDQNLLKYEMYVDKK